VPAGSSDLQILASTIRAGADKSGGPLRSSRAIVAAVIRAVALRLSCSAIGCRWLDGGAALRVEQPLSACEDLAGISTGTAAWQWRCNYGERTLMPSGDA